MFVDQRLAHIEMALKMAEAALYRRQRDSRRAEAALQGPPQRPTGRPGGHGRD
jgi:hypothetical protein